MSKSPWANIGAWAAEAERAEAEEREQAEKEAAAAAAAGVGGGNNFPSLKEAVNTKQKKKTKMSLQEFTMQAGHGSGSAPPGRGLTPEEMLRLPTRPKERSSDEMQHGRLGGGFPSYGNRGGSGYGGGYTDRTTREFENRRSYGVGSDDENRRGPPRVSEFDQQPSRADGVDNWALMKKALPEYTSAPAGRPTRYSSLGGSSDGFSRADEVDNWTTMKKPISQPPPPQQPRSSGVRRPEPDRWTGNEGERQRLVLDPPRNDTGGPEAVVKVNRSNPFGAARPREEVLAEKGLDWKKLDKEIEVKKQQSSVSGSRPTSSHSSRPESAHSSRSESVTLLQPGMAEGAVKQTPKVNPFGDAKPREVLLEQKGLDWKKIDRELERRRIERPETEEEKSLKEEIEHLKREMLEKSGEEKSGLQDLIVKREKDLELLTLELDDKVRYSQRVFERPGSGAGRVATPTESRAGFQDRPPSRPGAHEDPRPGYHGRPPSRPGSSEQSSTGFPERPYSGPGRYEESRSGFPERPSRSGSYEESRAGFDERSPSHSGAYQEPRAGDYMERPRSRGSVNSWTRPSDDRRAYQGGGGGGFLGSRDIDRSRPRW